MPYLLKFYTTLPAILNDKSFNVIIKLHSKRFEVKNTYHFLESDIYFLVKDIQSDKIYRSYCTLNTEKEAI